MQFDTYLQCKTSEVIQQCKMKKGYNSDLIFASSSIADMCEKYVMEPIPNTQHRPIHVRVKPVIVARPAIFKRRFNLSKADWNGYSTELNNLIEDVDTTLENYGRFIELIRVTSGNHIARELREQYIPGLSEESQILYEADKKQYSRNPFGNTTIEAGTRLVDRMTGEKNKRWEEVITSTDLTHNSRKAWQTIRTPPLQHVLVWSTPTK